jgi:4'-phosphopantetheinyl transferase
MNFVSKPAPTVAVREFYSGATDVSSLALAHDEIHVWHQSFARSGAELDAFRSYLSPDELLRAGRFRFDADRHEYIISRGTLRTLLGRYLQVAPQDLRIAYSEFGRPYLIGMAPAAMLDFNVSHSGDLALLAFASGRKIGIDVERVRCNFGTSEIAARFFSEEERAALRELAHHQRHQAFFRCWTRKEAFIKALGEGLSHPLDQFDVSLAPAAPAALLATRPDDQEAKRWMLWDIRVPNDYAATLAAESK